MQIHHDKERRCAGGMHVAHQPAPRHFAHDVLNRCESKVGVRLVVHDQENPGHNLDHQHQCCKRAKQIEEVEVLRSIVLAPLVIPQLGEREAIIDPGQCLLRDRRVSRQFGFMERHFRPRLSRLCRSRCGNHWCTCDVEPASYQGQVCS